jgi:hypothetical protein
MGFNSQLRGLNATIQVTLKVIRVVLKLSRNISGLRREVICMTKWFTTPSVNKHNQWSTIIWLTLLWIESENLKDSTLFRKIGLEFFFYMHSRIIMKKASRQVRIHWTVYIIVKSVLSRCGQKVKTFSAQADVRWMFWQVCQ